LIAKHCRRLSGAAVSGVLVVVLATCSSGGGSSAPDAGRLVTHQPSAVTAVQPLDARHLRITADTPGPGCTRNLRAVVTDSDPRQVYVQVTYQQPSATSDAACTKTTSSTVIVSVPPLHGRPLVIDSETPWIAAAGSQRYQQCTGAFGCDNPPRNHCDPQWLRIAAARIDELPPERNWVNRGCDGRWLVLDMTATITGCQPLDGATPPADCAAAQHHARLFYRFKPAHGWVTVASGIEAGCSEVHATVSAFPPRLCRHLPAT
jgi:hypothetical protein